VPTIVTHAVVPVAIAIALAARSERVSRRLLAASVVAAILPDADVVAFRFGIEYAHELGHRGFSHSLVFALALGTLAAFCAPVLRATRWMAFALVAVSAASHGLLDMATNGGLGVAFAWPFSDQRYFWPWRPVEVSPLSLRRIFGEAGLRVAASELLWVWLPVLTIALAARQLRRARPAVNA